jgi:uncharacterized membrane protein YhaH (DUF805 family)
MLVICAIQTYLTENTEDATTFTLTLFPMTWVSLATWTKRCHDCGYNGWWLFVPFFNFIFLFKKGDAGSNRYGDDPRN